MSKNQCWRVRTYFVFGAYVRTYKTAVRTYARRTLGRAAQHNTPFTCHTKTAITPSVLHGLQPFHLHWKADSKGYSNRCWHARQHCSRGGPGGNAAAAHHAHARARTATHISPSVLHGSQPFDLHWKAGTRSIHITAGMQHFRGKVFAPVLCAVVRAWCAGAARPPCPPCSIQHHVINNLDSSCNKLSNASRMVEIHAALREIRPFSCGK
jgi:hypothetical protein